MINPYYVYIFGFSISLLLYSLNWSTLYPELKFSLILFILLTFAIAFCFGSIVKRHKILSYTKITYNSNILKITILNCFLWSANMAYNRMIPLLYILRGDSFFYTDFTGVPTLHVFIMTFQSFFCTYLFHMFLSTKSIKVLCFYIINLCPFLLIFSRGGFLIVIIASTFVYLASKQKQMFTFNFYKIFILKILPVLFSLIFIFGVLGNLRNTSQLGGGNVEAGNNLIYQFAEVTPDFVRLGIPSEFLWVYLYSSSPLANLQQNMNNEKNIVINLDTISGFIIDELMPDFVSKRLQTIFGLERREVTLISKAWTTTTVYSGSYFHLSWLGLVIMACFIMFFPLLYISLFSPYNYNNFHVSAIATLNTLYFFLLFDNMFYVSAMSFQLVYPLIASKIFHKKSK